MPEGIPDMSQCERHGYALLDEFGTMFAWAISMDEAVRVWSLHKGARIFNVQNWAELHVS